MIGLSRDLYCLYQAELIDNAGFRFCEAYQHGLKTLRDVDAVGDAAELLLKKQEDTLAAYRARQAAYRLSLDLPAITGLDETGDAAAALARLAASELAYRQTLLEWKSDLIANHAQLASLAFANRDSGPKMVVAAMGRRLQAHHHHISLRHMAERARIACFMLNKNETEKAAEALKAWLDEDPSQVDLHELYGQAMLRLDRHEEAVKGFVRAMRALPEIGLFRSPGFSSKQRQAIKRGIPPIFFNTQFKSGSVFLRYTFERALDIPYCFLSPEGVSGKLVPEWLVVPEWLADFARGGAICQHHRLADPELLTTLAEAGIDRFILHIRDPRQVMISAVHHFTNRLNDSDPKVRLRFQDLLPEGYGDWDFEKKIDLFIDKREMAPGKVQFQRLGWEIKWIADWLELIANNHTNININITQYKDMQANSLEFIKAILDFYEIDHSLFDFSFVKAQPKPGEMHFRRGDIDEWRRVLTPKQLHQISDMMPPTVLALFGD